jgi:hypothetical protein
VKIEIHSTRGIRPFTFGADVTAGAATAEAVRAFDFSPDNEYGLLISGNTSTPLRNDRTLASYSIPHGATLFLTITGCRTAHLG